MAQIVKLKRTSVAGRIPTTSNIEVGELAFNSNDKSLFIRGDSNAIVAIHDESTLHIDTTNNRIGIGNTSPSVPLEVSATATTSTDIAHFSNSNDIRKAKFHLSGGGDGQLSLFDGNNNINVLLSALGTSYLNAGTGNVGIGTTSPGSQLTVAGDIRQTTGDLLYSGGGNWNLRHLIDDQSITFDTTTGGTTSEKMRVKGDGKVAIGDDDPDGNYLLIRAASTVGTINGHIMLTGDSATVGQGPQIVFSESGSGSSNAGAYIGHIRQGSNSIGDLVFGTRGTSGDANTVPTERVRIDSSGHVLPAANNTYNLGSSSNRWANLYVNDAHFSNEGSTNSVDGTWGDWTLQEGENDIYMINNRSGKKYKFNLTEVS